MRKEEGETKTRKRTGTGQTYTTVVVNLTAAVPGCKTLNWRKKTKGRLTISLRNLPWTVPLQEIVKILRYFPLSIFQGIPST